MGVHVTWPLQPAQPSCSIYPARVLGAKIAKNLTHRQWRKKMRVWLSFVSLPRLSEVPRR